MKRVGSLQVQRVDDAEHFADHLERVDLGQARAVVLVVEVVDRVTELGLALLRVAHAEVSEPLRNVVDVLVRDVDEQARRLREVVVGQLPGEPEVDEPDQVRAG